MSHRVFRMPVASVYVHYVTKVEKKGRSRDELDEAIRWLTGFDQPTLEKHLADDTNFEDFFAAANLNQNASKITGVICGHRVEEIDDPLM